MFAIIIATDEVIDVELMVLCTIQSFSNSLDLMILIIPFNPFHCSFNGCAALTLNFIMIVYL